MKLTDPWFFPESVDLRRRAVRAKFLGKGRIVMAWYRVLDWLLPPKA